MTSQRDAVLEGTLEAEQLHSELNANTIARVPGTAVDIFSVIDSRGINLLFQKLGGLLGAYLNFNKRGILVTTERTLAIQRFTAAHELGHAVLNHRAGIDGDDILTRSPFGTQRYLPEEVAADTFAAMFLMPEYLINEVATRQRWDSASIQQPAVIYQMALRLGVSYEALVRTLTKYKILSASRGRVVLDEEIKSIKRGLLGNRVLPPDWRCNIWELTERDAESVLIAEPNDFFVIRLREMSSAGYLWNVQQAREAGFSIVADERFLSAGSEIGSDVERRFTAQPTFTGQKDIRAVQSRPWDPDDIAEEFRVKFDIARPAIGFTLRHRMEVLAA
ncbi:ImmA/IrrE family metallo-endopeptidase [Terriglobus albidus]|uniref:ImmA/IrrE family metallo-endopeptidase n=1 Tax=Terriglobus albidus TaxID=1592106 RepID=UPI0021DFA32B|nr:ImmA/IrrE family metallo-endopeptidase [Terriglobus albidus]